MGDDHRFSPAAGVRAQPVGQACRGAPDGEEIDAVDARADDAAHPTGTKGEVRIEAVFDCLSVVPDPGKFLQQVRFCRAHVKPFGI